MNMINVTQIKTGRQKFEISESAALFFAASLRPSRELGETPLSLRGSVAERANKPRNFLLKALG
jgi:hypothetical protein